MRQTLQKTVLTGLWAFSFSLECLSGGSKLAVLNVEHTLKEINEKLLFSNLIRAHPSSRHHLTSAEHVFNSELEWVK